MALNLALRRYGIIKGRFQSQVEAVNFELFICTMSDRCQIWLCFSWKLNRCSLFGNFRSISLPPPGCEPFDRQPGSLIHLHTCPSRVVWGWVGESRGLNCSPFLVPPLLSREKISSGSLRGDFLPKACTFQILLPRMSRKLTSKGWGTQSPIAKRCLD